MNNCQSIFNFSITLEWKEKNWAGKGKRRGRYEEKNLSLISILYLMGIKAVLHWEDYLFGLVVVNEYTIELMLTLLCYQHSFSWCDATAACQAVIQRNRHRLTSPFDLHLNNAVNIAIMYIFQYCQHQQPLGSLSISFNSYPAPRVSKQRQYRNVWQTPYLDYLIRKKSRRGIEEKEKKKRKRIVLTCLFFLTESWHICFSTEWYTPPISSQQITYISIMIRTRHITCTSSCSVLLWRRSACIGFIHSCTFVTSSTH